MKKRILNAKLMALPLVGLLLVSRSAYDHRSAVGLVLQLAGFVMLMTASMGRVWTSAYIAGKKNRELVCSGPYSAVRNPLYLFSLTGFIGAGLAFKSIILVVLFLGIFFLTHYPTILNEEQKLRGKFGDAYDLYMTAVPRLIPRPRSIRQPSSVNLDPSTFTGAVLDSSLILLAFPAALILEWLHAQAILPTLLRLY